MCLLTNLVGDDIKYNTLWTSRLLVTARHHLFWSHVEVKYVDGSVRNVHDFDESHFSEYVEIKIHRSEAYYAPECFQHL